MYLRCSIALLLAGHSFAAFATSSEGDLDSAFGTGSGIAFTGESTITVQWVPRPALLADGRIVLRSASITGGQTIEDFFVAQFTADGALDPSFNFNCKGIVDFDLAADACNAVRIQPDGKIVLVGSSTRTTPSVNSDFAIARLNAMEASTTPSAAAPAGSRSASIATEAPTMSRSTRALQTDHKIVVAGWADDASGSSDFAVVRLMPDGTRDTSFGTAGRVVVPFDFTASQNKVDRAYSVAIDDQGRIVMGGSTEVDGNSFDFAVVRLLSDGSLDANFDGDGRATVAIGFDGTDLGIADRAAP